MATSGQNTCVNTIWLKAIFLLPLISMVTGSCRDHVSDGNGLYAVKCTCSNPNEDLEITPELSINFINASSLEVTQCRNVVLHSNLFRRSYNLHTISISHLGKLSFDPALSLPISLQTFSLSEIGSLDHFPAPGPSSALLHSVKSLELLSLEDITITAPPITSTSSFVDLPITRVYLNGVKFVGTIPKQMLHFNSTSLVHFSAIKCQFSDMVEGSFYIHASGNVTIDNCTFKPMELESMKVYGQCIEFSNNVFQELGGTHSISIQGNLHISLMKNYFKTLGAPHALLLAANNNAFVFIKGNQLPCGCYAENFIPVASNKVNQATCKADDTLVCALQHKQYCLHGNNKNETITISRPGLPPCPGSESASTSGLAQQGQIVNHINLMVMCIGIFMVTHGVNFQPPIAMM